SLGLAPSGQPAAVRIGVVPIRRTRGDSRPPHLPQIRKTPLAGRFAYLAERGGFEPPRRYKRLPDFESGTFNHSATSPVVPAALAASGGAIIRGRRAVDKRDV